MSEETATPILDAKGQEIKVKSIVGMSDPEGPWSNFEGLVVDPKSTIEDDEYCVAVYFYREVGDYEFIGGINNILSLDQWSKNYREKDRNSETDFLFESEIWKKSPRVRFFKPEELVVLETWSYKTLVQRLFKNSYHSVFDISKTIPQEPDKYMCWSEECRDPATHTAIYNIWGSVSKAFVCKTCFDKMNGLCADSAQLKRVLMTPEGKEIIPTKT